MIEMGEKHIAPPSHETFCFCAEDRLIIRHDLGVFQKCVADINLQSHWHVISHKLCVSLGFLLRTILSITSFVIPVRKWILRSKKGLSSLFSPIKCFTPVVWLLCEFRIRVLNAAFNSQRIVSENKFCEVACQSIGKIKSEDVLSCIETMRTCHIKWGIRRRNLCLRCFSVQYISLVKSCPSEAFTRSTIL